MSKRLQERRQQNEHGESGQKRKRKPRAHHLHDGTLLGQTAWASFVVLILCSLLITLLLLGGLLRGLSLCSFTGIGGRSLGLRLGAAMQSVDLGNGLVERLALSLSDLELESARLAGTVGTLS